MLELGSSDQYTEAIVTHLPSEKFYYPLIIKEFHLDTFGHVNNATYLQILEEARWELITSRGFGMKTIQKTGTGPTIVEINMKFKKEIRLRQKIMITSQTLSYDNKIAQLRHEILNEDQELLFEALLTFGLFDVRERKLVAPTPEWLYAVGVKTSLTD